MKTKPAQKANSSPSLQDKIKKIFSHINERTVWEYSKKLKSEVKSQSDIDYEPSIHEIFRYSVMKNMLYAGLIELNEKLSVAQIEEWQQRLFMATNRNPVTGKHRQQYKEIILKVLQAEALDISSNFSKICRDIQGDDIPDLRTAFINWKKSSPDKYALLEKEVKKENNL
jgi:hypothetical protein